MIRLEKIWHVVSLTLILLGLILVFTRRPNYCQSTDKVVVSIGMCDSEYCQVQFSDGTIKTIHHPLIGEKVSVCP